MVPTARMAPSLIAMAPPGCTVNRSSMGTACALVRRKSQAIGMLAPGVRLQASARHERQDGGARAEGRRLRTAPVKALQGVPEVPGDSGSAGVAGVAAGAAASGR